MESQLASWAIPAFAGAVAGALVSWGAFKERLNHQTRKVDQMETEISKLAKQDEVRYMSTRLDGYSTRISALERCRVVLPADCAEIRSECHDRLCREMTDVKEEIAKNRQANESQFKEIIEFMGYVKRAIEKPNGAFNALKDRP